MTANHAARDGFSALFSFDGKDRHRETLSARLLHSFLNVCNEGRVHGEMDGRPAARLFLNSDIGDAPISFENYIEYLAGEVVPYSINLSSPRCLGHMTGVVPGFIRPLADLVTRLNQNMVKREASGIFSALERQTIAMMHRTVFGLPESFYNEHIQNPSSTLGVMTSGGTLANLTGLWIARNTSFAPSGSFTGIENEGLPAALRHYGWRDAVIVGSNLVHYSIDKAAGILGLGVKNLIKVPVDRSNGIDLDALRRCIRNCADEGRKIIAIVGIAGTTDCGSVDPLDEIASIAREAGIHFHVDGAWCLPLLFSRRHCSKLAGVEKADTVTFDGHKQLCLPIGSGMLLIRDPHAARVIEKQTRYILQEFSGDLGKHSIEGSRPGTALFLHAALRLIGRNGYGALIDESICRAQFMADLIRNRPDFQLLTEPETNIVLYRYIPEPFRSTCTREFTTADNQSISTYNERIQQAQFRSGRSFVSRTQWDYVSEQEPVTVVALRAVVANPFTSQDDIRFVLEDQARIAQELAAG